MAYVFCFYDSDRSCSRTRIEHGLARGEEARDSVPFFTSPACTYTCDEFDISPLTFDTDLCSPIRGVIAGNRRWHFRSIRPSAVPPTQAPRFSRMGFPSNFVALNFCPTIHRLISDCRSSWWEYQGSGRPDRRFSGPARLCASHTVHVTVVKAFCIFVVQTDTSLIPAVRLVFHVFHWHLR